MPKPQLSVVDRTAIVTGGSGGIGRTIEERFVADGANLKDRFPWATGRVEVELIVRTRGHAPPASRPPLPRVRGRLHTPTGSQSLAHSGPRRMHRPR